MNHDVSVWIDLLRDVGFPILLAAYLLLRFEKRIRKLSEAIEKLKRTIQKKMKRSNSNVLYSTGN